MTIRSTIQHKNLFYSWRFFFLKNIVMYWKNKWKLGTRDTHLSSSPNFSVWERITTKIFRAIQRFRLGIDQPVWGAKLWGAKISSNLPNLDSLCLNWPFGVEIGLYLMQIASKIGQLNSLTNCLVFLVSLGQISLVNFYLVSKPRNFCSLFLVSHPSRISCCRS